jgi:hypothetical protein
VGDRGLLQSLLVVGEAATLDLEVTVQGAVARVHADGRSDVVEIPAEYGGGSAHPFAVFSTLPVGARLFADAVALARAGDAPGAAALSRRPEWAGFDAGVAAQEVVDAARRSADGGGWELVPPADAPRQSVADAAGGSASTASSTVPPSRHSATSGH